MACDPFTEVKLSGESVYQGQLLKVWCDTVQLPDGGVAAREYVVHPGSVMVIALLEDATGDMQLIIERQFRYPMGHVIMEFPAGKREPEESAWSCAKRELLEETGYFAAYFSPSWTAFQADRGRDFSVMVDGISN